MINELAKQVHQNAKDKVCYVLIISEFFPKTHNKAGLPTGFINAISSFNKIHTIRGNYELWKKRAEKINRGEATLSVRCWTDKPYNSKQREVFVFEKVGVEKIFFDDYLYSCQIEDRRFGDMWLLSENDGLSDVDFENWFKGYDFLKPMAIIHFTNFRYNNF